MCVCVCVCVRACVHVCVHVYMHVIILPMHVRFGTYNCCDLHVHISIIDVLICYNVHVYYVCSYVRMYFPSAHMSMFLYYHYLSKDPKYLVSMLCSVHVHIHMYA